MNTDTVRILMIAIALYMVLKTITAPRRGTFLTAPGNISRAEQPRAFAACLIAGWTLAAAFLIAALYANVWLPIFKEL